MNSRILKAFSFIGLTIVSLVALSPVTSGQSTVVEDQAQVAALITNFQQRKITAEAALDPEMMTPERRKNLLSFEESPYELNLAPTGNAQILPAGRARVELRVHFQNALDQIDVPTHANFVKRNGTWYFANFAFLETPAWLIAIAVLVPGLVAGSYVTGLLIVKRRLQREGRWRGANFALIFIPFFWPFLLRGGPQADISGPPVG